MGNVVFVFIDGMGLAPAGEHNPLSWAPMPFIHSLLGGPLTVENLQERENLLLKALDACLGVEGLPQSATGQTALFTGVNAPALVGAHLHAWPTGKLVEVIKQRNILRRAKEAGFRVTFANAYTPHYLHLVQVGKLRYSATSWSTLSTGLQFRSLDDLKAGRAVYWDITNEFIVNHLKIADVPIVEPEQAGRNLARLAGEYDLTLFETFLLDLAGHRRVERPLEEVFALIDRFLKGLMDDPSFTLVVSSDHGNVEDDTTRNHTRNPVPLLAVGPGAHLFHRCQAITDVADAIMDALTLL